MDRSKLGRRAKRKGKRGERQVAEMLSRWCGFPLRRTPQSGGGPAFVGDIIPKNEQDWARWPIVVEVKTRSKKALPYFLHKIASFVHEFWDGQLNQEIQKRAESLGFTPIPIFIFKADYSPWMIAFEWPRLIDNAIHLGEHLWVMELSTFLKTFNFSDFVAVLLNSNYVESNL